MLLSFNKVGISLDLNDMQVSVGKQANSVIIEGTLLPPLFLNKTRKVSHPKLLGITKTIR